MVDSRALKSKELVFYNERLDELNIKLGVIQREIVITKFIIDAIGREQILDLKDFTK